MVFRKQLLSLLLITCISFIAVRSRAQTKGYADRSTKEFFLTGNIKYDDKIFGYTSPDTNSKKLILFSVFTNDVKDNPYYETSNLKDGDKIEFVSVTKSFINLKYISSDKTIANFYTERKYIEFL